jgi:uncharacterized protein YabN with tetrapyrrole methylase and pyrophosphatase domain
MKDKKGSLVVVGTGIRLAGQLTVEAIAAMKSAEWLVHLVQDPILSAAVASLNPGREESLIRFYGDGKNRDETYEEMIDRVLSWVRRGVSTCFAVYGHPGVCTYPTHESVRRARLEGYCARMLPGISAEDCLFAELGVDPATYGLQSYEASDFLINKRVLERSSPVILWQVRSVGDPTYRRGGDYDLSALPLLIAKLLRTYPADHLVYLYRTGLYPGQEAKIQPIKLGDVNPTSLGMMSTMYIPPSMPTELDPEFLPPAVSDVPES